MTEETISIANKAAVTEVEKILKTLADGNVLKENQNKAAAL